MVELQKETTNMLHTQGVVGSDDRYTLCLQETSAT